MNIQITSGDITIEAELYDTPTGDLDLLWKIENGAQIRIQAV